MGLVASLTIGIGLLILMELLLWVLFRRRIAGLVFPHEFDESFFRFFTLRRMEIVAVAHLFFLCAAYVLSLIAVW